MAWPISKTWEFEKVVQESAKFPNIRFLMHQPGRFQWQVTSPSTTGANSAVCYFFARSLHQKLNIPIGIITSAVGGTPIEFWMKKESAERCQSKETGGRYYDSMLSPLRNTTIRGFHWYQGENVNFVFSKSKERWKIRDIPLSITTICERYSSIISTKFSLHLRPTRWF
jgi:hypothetical protein